MTRYARDRFEDFLAQRTSDPEVADEVRGLGEEHRRDVAAGLKPPPWEDTAEGITAYALWLMDRDRKTTALKALQGMIWRAGYAEQAYRAHFYPDAVAALRAWHAAGHSIYVYSSGSVAAQQLFFRHADAGDLSGLISGWFDTETGPKRDAGSYARIAAATGHPAGELGGASQRRERTRDALEGIRGRRGARPCRCAFGLLDRLPAHVVVLVARR